MVVARASAGRLALSAGVLFAALLAAACAPGAQAESHARTPPLGINWATVTAATPSSSMPSTTDAILTECPDSNADDSCGCDYDTHGATYAWSEGSSNVKKCAKCPTGYEPNPRRVSDDGPPTTCYSCPNELKLSPANVAPQCYGQDVDVHFEMWKCVDGGTSTNAAGTAAPSTPPTTSNCRLWTPDKCNECRQSDPPKPYCYTLNDCDQSGYDCSGSEDVVSENGRSHSWTCIHACIS